MQQKQATNRTINWGIIGCGDVTEVKSGPAYQQVDSFAVRAVMRRDYDKAKDYAKRHGVDKVYKEAEALIHSPDVDAVYIATPPDSHLFYALQVAQAQKPCCIEKPLAPSYAECVKIYEAFEKHKAPLFVAYYRRCLPRFNQVKAWIDSGAIGEIRHVHWSLCMPPNKLDLSENYNWRTDPKIAPGGYFDDLASHGLDLFAYYFGEFIEVGGISRNQQGLYKSADALSAHWLHASGVSGSGFWNFGCALQEDKVEVLGSKGKIEFSIFANQAFTLKTDDQEIRTELIHPTHIQHFHVEAMKNHLLDEIPHPSNGKTASHTAWVMDKILGKL